ncbi:hypothetical protein RRG08_018858 [Elysia crispata]|uniref:Cytochrome P450 n=1 Tax=Elysia crispata TaxID=231223 RepID=A0AAE1EBU8_9GAST|nr:hypothetical protein RRG08_018858 [Elysia crispata]
MLTPLLVTVTTTVTSWTLATGVLVLLVVYAWSKTRLKCEGSNIPPFPAPAKPLLGHTLLMKGNILDNFSWMRKKAGDLFSLNLLGQHWVVVNGYGNLREVLVKHADKTQDRPPDLSSKILGEDNHGLMSSHGRNWKEQRSITNSILREFGMGKQIMAEKVLFEVRFFMEKLASFKGQAIELPHIMSAAVCNVVCSITVGHRFDYDDEYYKRMMDNANAFLVKSPSLYVFYAGTILKRLPGDWFGIKQWENCLSDLNENFCKFQINKVKQDFSSDNVPESFIAAYLQQMRKKKESEKESYLDEPNLISLIKSLILAGTETSSTTINWCVLLCLHHPEIQEKVFDEIKTHVGTTRPPCLSDMPNLPYLSAVIRETQRFAGIAPVLSRQVTDTFEVQGYLIPKGSRLFLDINSALHDETTWENPHQFHPERFLDASGNLLKPAEFIPFGLGRRVCVGEALARTELDLFLATMFQRFQFEPENPTELPTLDAVLTLGRSPKPYKAKIKVMAKHSPPSYNSTHVIRARKASQSFKQLITAPAKKVILVLSAKLMFDWLSETEQRGSTVTSPVRLRKTKRWRPAVNSPVMKVA